MFGPIAIALAGFIVRITNLARPKGLVFDEVYYVDGARDFLKYGVDMAYSKPEFVVHPPVGKWLIAAGIKIFGDNEFGWRIAAAIAGTICIYLVGKIAYKLFADPIWATLASLLMFLDGFALVMSRTALLDIFLTLFILLAVDSWLSGKYFELAIWFGLALSTKWNAIFFIIAILALELYFNRNIFRVIKVKLIALAIYPITWMSWFVSSNGWGRDYSKNPLVSFFHYHLEMLKFHTNLTEKHNYQSLPGGWLIMRRPTSFYFETPKGCNGGKCAQEVLALGTPLLWWISILAICYLIFQVAKKRELDNLVIVSGFIAGYYPWFFFPRRTIFNFYSIVFEPFLMLAIVYACKHLYELNEKFKYLIGSGVAAITLNFYYFLPIFIGQLITFQHWNELMWFKSWI